MAGPVMLHHIFPRHMSAITPHDTNANEYAGIYVGVTGDVALTLKGSGESAVTLVGVPGGTFIMVETALVMSTNTTATNLVGFNIGI